MFLYAKEHELMLWHFGVKEEETPVIEEPIKEEDGTGTDKAE